MGFYKIYVIIRHTVIASIDKTGQERKQKILGERQA